MQTKKNWLKYFLYFSLLSLLLSLLILHTFNIYKVRDDFFTRYLIALIFVLMILPIVAHIKFFDIIDVRRDIKLFRKK